MKLVSGLLFAPFLHSLVFQVYLSSRPGSTRPRGSGPLNTRSIPWIRPARGRGSRCDRWSSGPARTGEPGYAPNVDLRYTKRAHDVDRAVGVHFSDRNVEIRGIQADVALGYEEAVHYIDFPRSN
jgi:hypothetical protein